MGARIQLKKDKEDHHPVEVVGRIRQNHPPTNTHNNGVAIQLHDRGVVRVRAESGPYRDFTLDGISWSGEALNLFYVKYIKSRIEGVKSGGKCTIILYGATGSGKSYTMFGSVKEPGIAYRALHHIMGEGDGDDKGIVKIKVVEVYNEDVYDLLGASSAKGAASPGRVRLEVRGRKVKNACSISGKRADDIVREIQTVEKRRVVKSTNCNERSSRSHCIIMVDVPSLGGQLILVDMAGSENIDQAAIGIEAKMQTGKINQGNGALKRVVEAIANGDNHIPYRDSKLTMLLQESGVEVDQETETELRVGSLPECSARKGCRLACLRPPRRIKLSLPPEKLAMPLSQIENQVPQATQSVHKKKGSKSSNAQTAPSPKKSRLKTMLNRDNKRKMTFKDKARALYFQDLACTFLHGV